MRFLCSAAAAALVLGASLDARQAALSPAPVRSVRELVARAGRYVADYGERLSLIVCTERYTQYALEAGAAQPAARTLVSEFALVRVNNDWMGLRDVFEVDGAAVRDRQDRLVTLLTGRSSDRLLQGRDIADESARYNLGPVLRNFNTPTAALFFLQPENQPRFRFTKEGEDTLDGTRVWCVKYPGNGQPDDSPHHHGPRRARVRDVLDRPDRRPRLADPAGDAGRGRAGR